MNEAGISGMPEIQRGQIDEVQDNDYLRPGKEGAYKEHNEGKVEEIVEDCDN